VISALSRYVTVYSMRALNTASAPSLQNSMLILSKGRLGGHSIASVLGSRIAPNFTEITIWERGTASIWTKDFTTARRAAAKAGFIWVVNDTAKRFIGTPFGGYKQSGIGWEECQHGRGLELRADRQRERASRRLRLPDLDLTIGPRARYAIADAVIE